VCGLQLRVRLISIDGGQTDSMSVSSRPDACPSKFIHLMSLRCGHAALARRIYSATRASPSSWEEFLSTHGNPGKDGRIQRWTYGRCASYVSVGNTRSVDGWAARNSPCITSPAGRVDAPTAGRLTIDSFKLIRLRGRAGGSNLGRSRLVGKVAGEGFWEPSSVDHQDGHSNSARLWIGGTHAQ
jgi:hypothetical protein